MKRYFKLIGIVVLMAALFAMSLAQVTAGEQLPFKAGGPEWVVQEGPGGACGAGRIDVQVAGRGQATHLGAYTTTRHHCFDPATATFADGTFELTAANGDTLYGTYTGVTAGVVEVDDQGNPVVIIIEGTQTIGGGTGRFADAEGTAQLYSEFNLVTKLGDFRMEGWLSY